MGGTSCVNSGLGESHPFCIAHRIALCHLTNDASILTLFGDLREEFDTVNSNVTSDNDLIAIVHSILNNGWTVSIETFPQEESYIMKCSKATNTFRVSRAFLDMNHDDHLSSLRMTSVALIGIFHEFSHAMTTGLNTLRVPSARLSGEPYATPEHIGMCETTENVWIADCGFAWEDGFFGGRIYWDEKHKFSKELVYSSVQFFRSKQAYGYVDQVVVSDNYLQRIIGKKFSDFICLQT